MPVDWKHLHTSKGHGVLLLLTTILPIILFISITIHDIKQMSDDTGTCPRGYFPCVNSSVCILQHQWCDDLQDCPEGDDEDFRMCKIHHRSFLFNFFKNCKKSTIGNYKMITNNSCPDSNVSFTSQLSSLTTILPSVNASLNIEITSNEYELATTLTSAIEPLNSYSANISDELPSVHNHLRNLNKNEVSPNVIYIYEYNLNKRQNRSIAVYYSDDFSFDADEKDHCRLDSFDALRCDGINLQSLPTSIPSKINKLFFSNNNIARISFSDFHLLQSVTILNMQNNKIIDIEDGSFRQLRLLTRLYLDENNITQINSATFFGLKSLLLLDLRHNQIDHIANDAFDGLVSLNCLHLDNNRIGASSMVSFKLPPVCFYIDLDHNQIQIISKKTFERCGKIKFLLLNYNKIRRIDDNAFEDCNNLIELDLNSNALSMIPRGLQGFQEKSLLEYLNLANNPFTEIPATFLKNLTKMKSINFFNVSLKNVRSSMFEPMINLKAVQFSNFEMCRYVPHVRVCKPQTDGISSISSLLDLSILGTCIWIVALVTCFGNVMVIICRLIFKDEKNVHSLFIKNLAAADFILGIYLLIIASHDVLYRNQYNLYALKWMEGWTCQITGFIGMVAIEVSVFILTCMSFECCLTVSLPLQPRIMTVYRAGFVLAFIWTAGAIIAGIPLIFASSFGHFYGDNGVCLPLHIHNPYVQGWQYSTFIFVFINLFGMLIIVICYTIIFCSLRYTRAKIPTIIGANGTANGFGEQLMKKKIHTIDKRLFAIVLTNVLCWIPVTIIKIMALNMIPISDTLYAWLTIFVVPINSALNPIIYSVTTPSFKKKIKKQYNIQDLEFNFRNMTSNIRSKIKSRGKQNGNIKACTATSLLRVPDIMLLHKYHKKSFYEFDIPQLVIHDQVPSNDLNTEDNKQMDPTLTDENMNDGYDRSEMVTLETSFTDTNEFVANGNFNKYNGSSERDIEHRTRSFTLDCTITASNQSTNPSPVFKSKSMAGSISNRLIYK